MLPVSRADHDIAVPDHAPADDEVRVLGARRRRRVSRLGELLVGLACALVALSMLVQPL